MKKVILISICIAIASNIGAQQYLNKYLRGEVGTDTLIKQAVESSAVIVKQSYQVKNKKTGSVYGRSGRTDFGHTYSVGVKTEAGLILTNHALKPWLFDSAFKKVEQRYEPIISLTEIRNVRNDKTTKFSQYPLQIGRNQLDGIWIANANKAKSNDMEIDIDEGNKDGWIIWFFVNKDLDVEPSSEIVTKVVHQKYEVIRGEDDLEMDSPTVNGTLLGGIYVSTVFPGGGHVTFQLTGIAVEEAKQWKIRTPFAGFSFLKTTSTDDLGVESEKEENKQEDDQEVELTPIEKNKKSKKSKK